VLVVSAGASVVRNRLLDRLQLGAWNRVADGDAGGGCVLSD